MKTKSLSQATSFGDKLSGFTSILFVISIVTLTVCYFGRVNQNAMVASVVFVALLFLYKFLEALLDQRESKRELQHWKMSCKRNISAVLLLLLCSSCGSTLCVQGVKVHAPTRTIQKKDLLLMGAGALAGFVIADRLAEPQQKAQIRKSLNLSKP